MYEQTDNKKINKQELKSRDITVNDNGSLTINEVIEVEYTQDYRDFLSDLRQLGKYKAQIESTLFDDFKDKQKERLNKIDEELEKLKPFQEEAEKKFVEMQKKQQEEMMKQMKKAHRKERKANK